MASGCLEEYWNFEGSEKREKEPAEFALAVHFADMTEEIKELDRWVAAQGGAYLSAVHCFVSGMERSADVSAIGAKSPV